MMPGSQHTDAPVYTGTRLPAIDTMRGIVMVLMAMDHASHVFNAGRYVRDSFRWYPPGSEIPAAQFLTRWVTHLCAPTFLFLAGLVLALSVAKRQALGDPERSIDGDIIKRGIFILLLDPLDEFWVWGRHRPSSAICDWCQFMLHGVPSQTRSARSVCHRPGYSFFR
jgi:uncharacterized membrane protein